MSTEVVIQDSSQRPLHRKIVRDGIAGNYEVVYEMIRLIRGSVNYDKGVEAVAKDILINAGLDSYSSVTDQLHAVFNYIIEPVKNRKHRVLYIQDIAGRVESLKDARQTLSDGWGDCDDQTVLNATLLGCLGFEHVYIAMARYSKDETSFSHVYCVVYENGQRYVLDTTLPNAKLNDEVKAYEVKEISVFDDVQGLDGVSGWYNNARYHTKKTAKTAMQLLPSAVNVLPFGFAASSAFATGASLLDQTQNKNFSLPAIASQINAELDIIILDLMQSKIAYDLAKSQALQVASQLATVQVTEDDAYTLAIVGASIKEKLNFIENFKNYAHEHNIKVVHLDSRVMLAAGLVLTAGIGYFAYKGFKLSRIEL